MAEFSSHIHKWRATNKSHDADAKKVTKRNRQPVSCQSCRARKLKCDRGHPCDACTKRGEGDTCVYGKAPPGAAGNVATGRRDDGRAAAMRAQDRLKHLEDLVRSIAEAPAESKPPPPADASAPGSVLEGSVEEGHINKLAVGDSTYAGSTHWSAILQHIHELKNDVTFGPNDHGDEPIDYLKPDSLFCGQRPPSQEYILKVYLPPRIQVDRRVSQYFNARYMILPILHVKQFRRQYEMFWQDPLGANVMWISILFSICCLAASLSLAANPSMLNDSDATNPKESFQIAASQCLLLGNYSKPQPYVIEALALFLQCKYSDSLDPQRELALAFGIQTRLAYLMGYHRDGSNFRNQFTPFEIEMRRRVWAMLKQFDLLAAFQLGIPNNIQPDSWDTKHPSNFLDADFDEDTEVLPPPRPETDVTQILYFVVKSRIIDIYTKICQSAISFSTNQLTAAEVMALDTEVREMADSIPESLRIRPIAQSITDQSFEIMSRLNASFFWRKSLCVLHRRYLTASGNEYSYKTCVESASAMCASIIDLYPEFQTGGAFENDGWMLTSFTIVDFLLAVVILCLAMSVSRKKYVNNGGTLKNWLKTEETKLVLDILDKSQVICVELGRRSREARRVSAVVSAVLDKLRTTEQGPVAGADGARSFPNMSNGTPRERDHPQTNQPDIAAKDVVNLQPLSITDRPFSVTTSSGIFPPEWLVDTTANASLAAGRLNLSPADSKSSTLPIRNEQTAAEAGFSPPDSQRFMSNGMTPSMFRMDMGLGPLANFMSDDEGIATIDWTQLDQFTGQYRGDSGFSIFAPASMPEASADCLPDHAGMPPGQDYANWESIPLYLLGARARDPVTGKSQLP